MHYKIRKTIGVIDKKRKNARFTCLHPNCGKLSIGSHSQQRGGQLYEICENKMVYALNTNIYEVIKKDIEIPSLTKTAIKNASVFPGFCNRHDTELFESIEKEILIQNSTIQVASFFLRTVCYEITRKKLAALAAQEMLKGCGDVLPQEVKKMFELQLKGRDYFFKRDMPYYLETAFDNFNKPESNRVGFVWKVINKKLLVSSCNVFSPIRNYDERMVDRLSQQPQVLFTFNLVPERERTHVIVAWLNEHEDYSDWIKNDIRSDLEKFINYIVVCQTEDLCVGPELWEGLTPILRDQIYYAMLPDIHREKITEIPCLVKL